MFKLLFTASMLLTTGLNALLVPPMLLPEMSRYDLDSAATQQIPFFAGQNKKPNTNKRVPVVLGVMSQCPDAELCESVFDKVLAIDDDIIDLRLVYIGQLNDTLTPYGVECKHGPAECDGNVQQLCVAANVNTQRDWWNFVQCQNFNGLKRVGDSSLAKSCAKAIKKNWDTDFSDCYTGSQGRELLQESVKLAHEMNITRSCTVIVNEKVVCIRDGVWKDCPIGHEPSDFQKVIEQEYKAINGQSQ